jgi:hypothetical protein
MGDETMMKLSSLVPRTDNRPERDRPAGGVPFSEKPRARGSAALGAHDIPSEWARPVNGVPSPAEPHAYPPVRLGQGDYVRDWHPDDSGSPESVVLWIFAALVTWGLAAVVGMFIAWILRELIQ